jgi:hypothetical protein
MGYKKEFGKRIINIRKNLLGFQSILTKHTFNGKYYYHMVNNISIKKESHYQIKQIP